MVFQEKYLPGEKSKLSISDFIYEYIYHVLNALKTVALSIFITTLWGGICTMIIYIIIIIQNLHMRRLRQRQNSCSIFHN